MQFIYYAAFLFLKTFCGEVVVLGFVYLLSLLWVFLRGLEVLCRLESANINSFVYNLYDVVFRYLYTMGTSLKKCIIDSW